MNNISEVIKKIRKDNNLTQKQLADKLNVTYQAVSKWENDKSIPDITTLKNISNKFNIKLDDLLGVNHSKKKKYPKIIILLLIFSVLSLFSYLLLNSDKYNFEKLESLNTDFQVSGVVAFSRKQNSLYISNIKYIKEDGTKYKNVSCSLYEDQGDVHIKVSECSSKLEPTNQDTLSNLLEEINFKLDNYTSTNKQFDEKNFYLEINAEDITNKTTSFKINISKENK